MATRKTRSQSTKARARAVASGGTAVRDRVRELSVRAFKERNLSLDDVPKVVNEVLDGAVQGIDRSIPSSGRNVLREVFDGLSEGISAIAGAGSHAVSSVTGRARAVMDKNVPDAARRIRAANGEFLDAVRSFAGTTSKQVREDLDDMVDRAQKTGPKVVKSARGAAKAADGRMIELSGETARAGFRAARRAVGAFAMGAGGFLEGLAEAVAPGATPERGPRKPAPKKASRKKTARKAAKKKSSRGKKR